MTGHYLCRGEGGGGEGWVKVILDSQEEGAKFMKKFSGISSLIARYFLRGVHWPSCVVEYNIVQHRNNYCTANNKDLV